jgi:hypothetical protein
MALATGGRVSVDLAGSEYRLVRRLSSAQWADDYDPTAGELPPKAQWAGVGAPQQLGLVRLFFAFVNSLDILVPGGSLDYRVVEPAFSSPIDGGTSIANDGVIATAVWSDAVTEANACVAQIVDASSAGFITFTVASVDPPAGATQLLIMARKV